MAETRTGAPYTHFEALYCEYCDLLYPLTTVGGELQWAGLPLAQVAEKGCRNCAFDGPLAHVSVTTADRIAGKEADDS